MSKQSVYAEKPASSAVPPGRAVTREMVHRRTVQLTLGAGRDVQHVRQIDYERAKLELTGETDGDRQQAVLNAGALPV